MGTKGATREEILTATIICALVPLLNKVRYLPGDEEKPQSLVDELR